MLEKNDIPQVVAILRIKNDGVINLTKRVRQQLNLHHEEVYLGIGDEIRLSTQKQKGFNSFLLEKNCLVLPAEAVERLGLKKGTPIAMVEREGDLAVKKISVRQKSGCWAEAVEIESQDEIERILTTNPDPNTLLPQLIEQTRSKYLAIRLKSILQGRGNFESWLARKMLSMAEPQDAELRECLIQSRLQAQNPDGSWEGKGLPTVRVLNELHALGTAEDEPVVQLGVEWLLKRARSEYNPGMFFLDDAMVEEQERIIQSRLDGKGGRFRQRKSAEIRRVREVIPTAHDPCGPRIMWPNALVLALLIDLGYEDHPRVQDALGMLSYGGWCECAYQHGFHGMGRSVPVTEEILSGFESQCLAEFRNGGLRNMATLLDNSLRLERISEELVDGKKEYTLRLPEHLQPCELITTLGLSRVKNKRLRRLAEAHLWRFAARQRPPDGVFTGDALRHVSMYFYLDLFARYDHPAARIVLLRALDWIVDHQNADGSWGNGASREADTLAVVGALTSLRKVLLPTR